jgi:uncharacterized protein YneF (UPF0154 family)
VSDYLGLLVASAIVLAGIAIGNWISRRKW